MIFFLNLKFCVISIEFWFIYQSMGGMSMVKTLTWRDICCSCGCLLLFYCENTWLSAKYHNYKILYYKVLFKACVRYFSLFFKKQYVSWLFRTKYFEKKFNLQLLYLPTVSRTFILSWATTRYPPPWNFLFRKNNCMCNRDNARDVATCPDE